MDEVSPTNDAKPHVVPRMRGTAPDSYAVVYNDPERIGHGLCPQRWARPGKPRQHGRHRGSQRNQLGGRVFHQNQSWLFGGGTSPDNLGHNARTEHAQEHVAEAVGTPKMPG